MRRASRTNIADQHPELTHRTSMEFPTSKWNESENFCSFAFRMIVAMIWHFLFWILKFQNFISQRLALPFCFLSAIWRVSNHSIRCIPVLSDNCHSASHAALLLMMHFWLILFKKFTLWTSKFTSGTSYRLLPVVGIRLLEFNSIP